MVLSDVDSGTELLNDNSNAGGLALSTSSDLVSFDVKSDSIHMDVTKTDLSESSAESSPPEPDSVVSQDGIRSPEDRAKQNFVYLPDLFSSIMAIDPCVNSNYHKVKPEADSWIKRVLHADERWAAKNTKADFAYLVALWAPYCDEEALRMMTDYNNWAFLFDDRTI